MQGPFADCRICYYSISDDLPQLNCRKMHGKMDYVVCQVCFHQWLHGDLAADNVGYKEGAKCGCGKVLTHEEVKTILDPEQFEEYDKAKTLMELEKMKDIVYCPGPDCKNAFLKPKKKRNKRQCRKATCDSCDTSFCSFCGEKYTKEHQRMKCGPYKKWKHQNDEETKQLNAWIESRREQELSMPCPQCKREVEKNGGCSSMKCTNCRCHFCWNCGTPFERYWCPCRGPRPQQ